MTNLGNEYKRHTESDEVNIEDREDIKYISPSYYIGKSVDGRTHLRIVANNQTHSDISLIMSNEAAVDLIEKLGIEVRDTHFIQILTKPADGVDKA